jgi:SAM-dependent methyltransferase
MIDGAVSAFAASLPAGARVLDAGAGESRFRSRFHRQRYIAADLAVGDASWDYGALDCVADLERLPFAADAFDACLNVVTLEHVREPRAVIGELARTLAPGGRLLLIAPHEWEEHQSPHDYFRFTRHGLRYLLETSGFREIEIVPAGGFFRLLSRRLCNAPQFFPKPIALLVMLALAVPALILPSLDGLDREKKFTLGFVCTARKS